MLKKYIVRKPNENRLKLLNFCIEQCEFSNGCFSLPLSNCCVKHDELESMLMMVDEKPKWLGVLDSECQECIKVYGHSEERCAFCEKKAFYRDGLIESEPKGSKIFDEILRQAEVK